MAIGQNLAIKTGNSQAILELTRKIYANNFYAVWTREVLQNSVDAGSKSIHILNKYISVQSKNARTGEFEEKSITKLTVKDDGCGMTPDVIANAFLAIGGSSKTSDTAVGGFGIAKTIVINGDHLGPSPFGENVYWYVITTVQDGESLRSFYFDSEMMDKEPLREIEPNGHTGTEITIYREDYAYQDHITEVLENSNVRAALYYNDLLMEQLKYARQVKDVKELDWCRVYFKSKKVMAHQKHRAIIRIGGIFQFSRYMSSRLEGVAIVEIDTPFKPSDEAYPLTPNREQIKAQFDYQSSLDGVLSTLNSPEIIEDEKEPFIFETIYNGSYKESQDEEITYNLDKKDGKEIDLFNLSDEEIQEQKEWEKENGFYQEKLDELISETEAEREIRLALEVYEERKRQESEHQQAQLQKAHQNFKVVSQLNPELFEGFHHNIAQKQTLSQQNELFDVNIESISVRRDRSFTKKPDLFCEKNLKRLYCFKVFIEMIFEAAGDDLPRFPYQVGWVLSERAHAMFCFRDGVRYILLNPVGMKTSATHLYEFVLKVTQNLVHELCHEHYSYHDEHFMVKFHDIMDKAVNPHFMEYVKVARKILK